MELFLVSHILLLSASMVVTAGSVIAAASGVKVTQLIKSANLGVTAAGIVCGIILLGTVPLDMRCVLLTAYVAVFWASQLYIERRNDQLALSPEA